MYIYIYTHTYFFLKYVIGRLLNFSLYDILHFKFRTLRIKHFHDFNMSRGLSYGSCFKRYFVQQKYTNPQRSRLCRWIHRSSALSRASATDANTVEERIDGTVAQKKSLKLWMRDLKTGPSLSDFLSSSAVEIPIEEPVPYVPKIRAENQKGFSHIFTIDFFIFILVCIQCFVTDIFLIPCLMLVYFEIYGCQMNVNDADIVWSVLRSHGYRHTDSLDDADIVLLITCAIRDSAEQKVWNKLEHLNSLKKKRKHLGLPMKIGLLGEFGYNINLYNVITHNQNTTSTYTKFNFYIRLYGGALKD